VTLFFDDTTRLAVLVVPSNDFDTTGGDVVALTCFVAVEGDAAEDLEGTA
jgi:hypothetical protein